VTQRPYIAYPKRPKHDPGMTVPGETLINEPGKACFGANDFAPGLFRPLHGHHTWELVVVDGSSEGPGYIFFDGRWWRVDLGAAVFVPAKQPHAWSSGNTRGFRMLYLYGGSKEEAGRIWYGNPEEAKCISPKEEANAPAWTPEAAGPPRES
jgi:hypothetical protein